MLSPDSNRASESFKVSRSTEAITSISGSRAVLIHKSIVSAATKRGASICSSTCSCSAGEMLARNRKGAARYAAGRSGEKAANTFSSVASVRREFISASYTPDHRNVLPGRRWSPSTSMPKSR